MWLPLDRAQVILEVSLVKPFRNAPTDEALEVPERVKNAFKSENGSVAGLLAEKQQSVTYFAGRLSDILLLPLNMYPGEYSIFHELAVYQHVSFSVMTAARGSTYIPSSQGMGHPETIRLGHM